jgi:glycosyltransferase involved in cell wall biosynthesis
LIWHLITSEYPPQPGGVSDYTQLVAEGLTAAGDEVHVWCPSAAGEPTIGNGVVVHPEPGRFGISDLQTVGRLLDEFESPRRLLVQWVPHGYGYRSMNLPFCLWLWKRAKLKHDRIEIMVHEPFLDFREGSRKQDMAAAVHRLMVIILLKAASHVWVSIPDWETRLRPFVRDGNKTFGLLPVPSNIPVTLDPKGVAGVRARYSCDGAPLVGHFGAYDQYMTNLMSKLLPSLLAGPDKLSVMLLGEGSLELRDRVIELHPDLSLSVHGTGVLSAEELSRHVSACDVMLQPYQDGVSGRRTSVMTGLAHGVPVVTNQGKATDSCWVESQAVKLTKADSISDIVEVVRSLLADEEMRNSIGKSGVGFYRERFDIRETVSALRRAPYETH